MWNNITTYFSFQAIWNPVAIVLFSILAVVYLYITSVYYKKVADATPVSLVRKLSFLLGLFLVYFGFFGPLYLMGHLMFSAHMVKMALDLLFAPPLLLLGTPEWLIRRVLKVNMVQKMIRFFTKPVVALFLFNGLFSIYHFPVVYDFLMAHKPLHNLTQAVLFLAASMMWWVLICPIKEWDRLTPIKKIGYIFADGALLTPSCALIIFASEPMYSSFTDPEVWSYMLGLCLPAGSVIPPSLYEIFLPLSLKHDQQLGGVIMKLLQEAAYGSVLAYTFIRWAREHKKKGIDPIDPIPANLEGSH